MLVGWNSSIHTKFGNGCSVGTGTVVSLFFVFVSNFPTTISILFCFDGKTVERLER